MEQIVVIILMLILASGLVFGIMKWVEWTQFKRQNEYARTLFVAAQNQLTEYSESGQLTALKEQVTDEDGEYLHTVDVSKLMGKDGKPYDLKKVWPSSADKGDEASKYQGEVCTLKGTAKDYEAYLDGTASDEIKALYDMFSSYLYDTSILNATVCVEFTPEDGQVFAVLYSDKNKDFTYKDTDDRRGTVSIFSRETSYRKRRMVGYYGVDMLSKATSTKAKKPSISAVRLNNEDTLNLTFHLSKVKKAVQELKYELTIHDRTTKKALLRLVLDGKKIKNEDARAAVPCDVTRYDYDEEGKSEPTKMGKYNILAWIDKDETIHVVLDGADLEATTALYEEAYPELMEKTGTSTLEPEAVKDIKNTLSFRRFGVNPEDIYCSIKGTGELYKTTAKKQSNTENTYFGSMQASDVDKKATKTYTVQNARHLYNMRYLEDYTDNERKDMGYEREADQVIYQISEDIDWEEFQDHEALFKSGAKMDGTGKNEALKEQAFPSIKQLRSDAVLESGGTNKRHTISGLEINDTANDKASLYEAVEGKYDKSAGLFLTNSGVIRNVAMDNISVEGDNSVGAFCGIDQGTLKDLTVKNSDGESVIKGDFYVGGIAGIREAKDKDGDVVYEGLTNYAKVTGADEIYSFSFFGGIIGELKAEKGNAITVKDCKNYGKIEAMNDSMTGLGGIAGHCEAKTGTITVQDCTSSPQYKKDEIRKILSSKKNLEERLKGSQVGGIVGTNAGAAIVGCNTEKESNSKEGYIFGEEYVGGIVGYNEPGADGTSKVIGGDGAKKGVNAAHVIGKRRVGGIIGANPADGTISGWLNRGFVAAQEEYAGGIAGCNGYPEESGTSGVNSAVIHNCSSEVVISGSNDARQLVDSGLFRANYTGGIAGYNDGIIASDKKVSLVCNLTGGNFVGGVVGYNDVDAAVANYAMTGGYVDGEGCYIGGFAGFNASINLLMDGTSPRFIESNPNQVKGRFCVGGTIGGNVVPAGGVIEAGFRTDNFLGELEADGAFAGGFIGYNRLVSPGVDKGTIQASANESIHQLEAVADLTALADPQGLFDGVYPAADSGSGLIISGNGASESHTKFGGITAGIHVGGVLGYNDQGTTLLVRNIVNKTPVTARAAVSNENEQPGRTDYNGQPFRYSYAGGIIGKVYRNTTIENCRNQDAGSVVSRGTYTGGLCEINDGIVKDCTVSSLGSGSMDYVGGIAGLNKWSIQSCKLELRTITGRNYVGGIVAENYGAITGSKVSGGTVRTYGTAGVAGGIAGYNYGGALIDISDTLNIAVNANGPYVGGIAGWNEGTIRQSSDLKDSDRGTVSGSITGSQYVGGIVGNSNGAMEGFYNKASVTARYGYAGGIAGIAAGNITDCWNKGAVIAQQEGNAGGIVANNNYEIRNCRNYGSVTAQNGISGGISGVNASTIASCQVTAQGGLGYLVFESKEKAGGVCGINEGTIDSTDVSYIQLYNLAGSKQSMLGGIAAENKGTITSCNVGNESNEVILKSMSAQVDMGGVAGVNSGEIRGIEGTYSKVRAKLSFASTEQAYFGNMGGVAGKNLSHVSWYEFSGSVSGTGNNPQNAPTYDPNTDQETNGAVIYGYGGIAGVNGEAQAMSQGTIADCKISEAKITGLGDANNVANIGGVAGVNGLGADISGITYGSVKKYGLNFDGTIVKKADSKASVYVGTGDSTTAYAHSGGVAGLNSGNISDIGYNRQEAEDGRLDASDYSPQIDDTSVIVENYRGHVGGIAGYNRKSGRIQNVATGKDWIVSAPQNAQDNGCGGIIGYQAGEGGLSYCTNRATVEKTASGSNGVGGMIGRMECATSKSYTIQNCKNYGNIYGRRRVGGMIGVWKYYGGTLSDCVNYGRITTSDNDGQGAGGMVGCLYDLRTTFGSVTITRCANHGTITGASSGGMIGFASQKAAEVHLRKCVNTGLLSANGNSGGMLGITGSISGKSTIIGCNNYGFGINSAKIGGMVPTNLKTEITIQDCFGLADLDYPIALTYKAADQGSNYYLGQDSDQETPVYYDKDGKVTTEKPEKFYVKSVVADGINEGQNAKDGNLYKTVMRADAAGLKDANRAYFSSDKVKETGTAATYVFTFNRDIELSSMDLYWNRNGEDGRVQDYEVLYSRYSSGGTLKTYQKVENNKDAATHADVAKNEKEQITAGTVTARRVEIRITKSVNNGGSKVNACLIRAIFHGNVDGVEYTSGQGGTTNGTSYTLDDGMTRKGAVFSGLPYETLSPSSAGEDTQKGSGTIAVPVPYGSGLFRLIQAGTSSNPVQIGAAGFPLNPLSIFGGTGNVKTDERLRAAGDQDDNVRYEVYEKDNPYFATDVAVDGTVPAMPEGVKIEGETATWDPSEHASYYQYEISYYDKDGNLLGDVARDIIYDTSTAVPLTSVGGIKVAKASIRVRAGTDLLGADGIVHASWSDFSALAEKEIKDTLPIPQYHLELAVKAVGDEKKLVYQSYLDNQWEYRQFLADHGVASDAIEAELMKIQIQIKADGKSLDDLAFNASVGRSAGYYGSTDGNAMFSAVATASGYEASGENLRESVALTHGKYKGDAKIALVVLANGETPTDVSKDVGFHGATADTLNYQVRMKYNINSAFYMRSELTAVDAQLNVPVAVASSELRVSDTTQDYIPTALSSLPEDLMSGESYSDLMVRSYPSMMSNNIVYNGHTVDVSEYRRDNAAGVEKEVLQQFYVTEDNQVTMDASGGRKLIDAGELASGFVIERAADGTYTLYYNALLDYNQSVKKHSYDKENATAMMSQVYYYQIPSDRKTHNAPVIHVNDHKKAGEDGNPNEDSMVIYWDLKEYKDEDGKTNYKAGAVYDYTVAGTTADGAQIQIASGIYTTEDGKDNELILPTDNWNYTSIRIAVSRRGEMDGNGITTVFPAGSVWESSLKLRLSQITKPELFLHKEGDEVQKNSLVYDVTWDSVPEAEQPELGGYEVTVEGGKDEAAVTQNYQSEEKYKDALERTERLFGGKEGVDVTDDSANGSMIYEWSQEAAAGTVKKRMGIAFGRSGDEYFIAKKLTCVWNFPVGEDIGQERITRMIDLNDYERGDTLAVRVNALAAENARTYRDGPDGVETEMVLPSRLDVPDVSWMGTNLPYAEDQFVTLDQLSDGIALSYKPQNVSSETQGRYQIAVAVYDAQEAEDTSIKYAGDAQGDGYWNSGAIATILSKDASTEMDGNLSEAGYVLKDISADYAGKWLKIAMRSISDSNVSSYWSDEDETVDGTVNYKWIQIPRVQVEAPSLTQGTDTLYYDDEGQYTDDKTDTSLAVEQTRLSYDAPGWTDHYQIQLIRRGGSEVEITPEYAYTAQYLDWIYLENAGDGGYHVFYASSDPAFDPRPYREAVTPETPVSELDEAAVYLGTIGGGSGYNRIMLPYTGMVAESADVNPNMVATVSYLLLEQTQDGQTFTVQLPDAEKVGGEDSFGKENDLFTSQISVQGRIAEGNRLRYEDSKVADWFRKNDGTAQTVELDGYAEAPQNMNPVMESSDREGIAYELKTGARNWLVYQIEAQDGAGNVIQRGYVSAYGYGTNGSDIDTVALLARDMYANPQGAKIRVRAAAILEGKNEETIKQGGLSQWTDWLEYSPLPELADPQQLNDPSADSGEDGDGGASDAGSPSVPMAAQTWEQDNPAAIYQIWIGGQAFETSAYGEGRHVLATLSANEDPSIMAQAVLEVTNAGGWMSYTLQVPEQSAIVSVNGQNVAVTFNSSVEIVKIN